jgi:6-phosphogluconolactonase (cycloisomerase 2 family)
MRKVAMDERLIQTVSETGNHTARCGSPVQGKQMTYKKMLQAAMAVGLSAAIGLGLAACSRDYTAAYVYSVSASNGSISAFGVDFQSGILTQINGSPFSSGLSTVTTIVPGPSGQYLYVIGGPQDASVVAIARGTDGKLYNQKTYSLGGGTYPTAAAVDSTGTYLYVTFTYQVGFTVASPGPGGIAIFKISSTDGTLTGPVVENGLNYVPVGNNPVSIAVSVPTCGTTASIPSAPACTGTSSNTFSNTFVYVVDQEAAPNATILGFAQNTSDGTLTPLSGTSFSGTLKTLQGYHAGVTPSAIAIDPTGRFVYVTDKTSNQIIGYTIDTNGTGNLTAMLSSPFGTGLFPVALTIEPRGKYLYTANYNDSTVSSFAIDVGSGSLSSVAGNGGFKTGAQPTCVTVEPELGIYLYTSNYLEGTISAGQLSANTGALTGVPDSPFNASALPACITSVTNGPHALQIDQP